jgi:hypothetical protein
LGFRLLEEKKMYIKLLGANENGFPQDCTVGKVYEIAAVNIFGDPYFFDDYGHKNFAYHTHLDVCGQWQVVDENGEGV